MILCGQPWIIWVNPVSEPGIIRKKMRDEHWQSDRYPWHGAYCGDIDLTGWRKPISHYRSLLYNDNEKLYLAVKEPNPENGRINNRMGSMANMGKLDLPRFEKDIEVEVYSKYPKSGFISITNSLVRQATTVKQQFKATFSVPYSPGD